MLRDFGPSLRSSSSSSSSSSSDSITVNTIASLIKNTDNVPDSDDRDMPDARKRTRRQFRDNDQELTNYEGHFDAANTTTGVGIGWDYISYYCSCFVFL
jgi:hypothetical protein